ncbi:hypothetical protein [Burkholderia sp. BCC0322]|uniref:hypothetical protein n=1 Tax=unclassified Burkholderia TaxID=2613784 RepID=UPI00158B892F|nr:hypothetical protein [Burkholderia sp. BCC0322]
MNITAVVQPTDSRGHCWQPQVLSTHTTVARYTSRPEWSSDGESMWMRLSKFSLFNRLSLHALAELVTARSGEAAPASADLRRADQFVSSRLAGLLEVPEATVLDGFCFGAGHPALVWADTELRYCPACLELGFHAAWFQWRFIERCPVHGWRLRCGCHKCAAVIPYALDSNMATYPLSCVHCHTSWVPMLDRPAGRCVPIHGRAARILRRWQVHVADAAISVAHTPLRPRDQVTGQFVPRWVAKIEIWMPFRFHCTRLLNRLYDVPPPSPEELLEGHRVELAMTGKGRIFPLTGEDRETDAIPYVREDWPHFGNDFLEYERILQHAAHELFGDIRRIAPVRLTGTSRYGAAIANARDMDADQAAALGWSISWYGFSRTCTPEHASCMPAMGLAGWLAYAPHRPAEVPPDRWRDQMGAWLAQDLARSAWAWSRMTPFMQARGKYLLHGQLVRPPELARLRGQPQSGTQALQQG